MGFSVQLTNQHESQLLEAEVIIWQNRDMVVFFSNKEEELWEEHPRMMHC